MPKDECVVCGQPHPRCNGHKKGSDPVRPCMNQPRRLENACRVHGGNHPGQRAAGAARRAAAEAEADAEAVLGFSMGGSIPDVLAAFEGLAAISVAMVDSLSQRVNALGRLRYSAHGPGTEQLRAEVAMLERSIERAGKMLELVAKHKPDGEATAARNLLTVMAEKLDSLDLDT